ncbi:MAG: geranylgeranylglyceryl/heptaprenylglyceryl phosphate synthase [Thermoplasmata archaeon]
MKVYEYIKNKLRSEKLHMVLIDPAKQNTDKSFELAEKSIAAGTDAIMIGGSTGITSEGIDNLILKIKKSYSTPIILFPNGVGAISRYADAIYFMSMLNSKNLKYVIRQQVAGAKIIKDYGIEPISMGYLVIEPGMTVGRIGEAELIKREDIDTAVKYAVAAEYLGMKLFYIEAGSGATMPAASQMVKSVKENITIPLIVGGGIRNAVTARELCVSGADIIVTGTILEEVKGVEALLREIIEEIKK